MLRFFQGNRDHRGTRKMDLLQHFLRHQYPTGSLDGPLGFGRTCSSGGRPGHFNLQRRFAEATGARYAFSYASGRMGLYAILEALGIGPGDEVIVPAFTCVVVPNSLIYRGVKPVYVDIDLETFNIDAGKIESKITVELEPSWLSTPSDWSATLTRSPMSLNGIIWWLSRMRPMLSEQLTRGERLGVSGMLPFFPRIIPRLYAHQQVAWSPPMIRSWLRRSRPLGKRHRSLPKSESEPSWRPSSLNIFSSIHVSAPSAHTFTAGCKVMEGSRNSTMNWTSQSL